MEPFSVGRFGYWIASKVDALQSAGFESVYRSRGLNRLRERGVNDGGLRSIVGAFVDRKNGDQIVAQIEMFERCVDVKARERGEMILTRVTRRVSSDATLDRRPGVAERLAGNHPIEGSLNGVFPLPQTIVALALSQRRDVSIHGRCVFFVGTGPDIQRFSRDVSGAQC